jgi:hypothetical protein
MLENIYLSARVHGIRLPCKLLALREHLNLIIFYARAAVVDGEAPFKLDFILAWLSR